MINKYTMQVWLALFLWGEFQKIKTIPYLSALFVRALGNHCTPQLVSNAQLRLKDCNVES